MKLSIIVSLLIVLLACSSPKSVTGPSVASDLIEGQSYNFVAQQAFPTEDARYNPRVMFPNGSQLYQLNGEYDLKIRPDSLIVYLPYFGRSFTAPVNPNEGGIKFTSTDFSYKKSIRKNNYEIEIVPNDNRDIRSLFLTVSPGGFASLRVLSLNKTAISFNGRIEATN